MRIRRFVLAVSATALLAAGAHTAHAEETIDYDVGGGAAALQIVADVQDYQVLPTLLGGKDRIRYANAAPQVTMGKNGGNGSRAIVKQRIGSLVTINSGFVSIKGNRQGTPFAEGVTELKGLTIQGTSIKALRTDCRWDKFGEPTGKVVVTNANGQTFEPEPNTRIDLPGIGTLFLNEQFIETRLITIDSTGRNALQKVIYVHGARLRLGGDGDLLGVDLDSNEIILGFTSCDPINLPNLGGLKLLSSPT